MPLHKILLDNSGLKYTYLEADSFKEQFTNLLNNILPNKCHSRVETSDLNPPLKKKLFEVLGILIEWSGKKGVHIVLPPNSIHSEKVLFQQRIVFEIMKLLSEIEFNSLSTMPQDENLIKSQNHIKELCFTYLLFKSRAEATFNSRIMKNIFQTLFYIMQLNERDFDIHIAHMSLEDSYANIVDKLMTSNNHEAYVNHFTSVIARLDSETNFIQWQQDAPAGFSREYQGKIQKIPFGEMKAAAANGVLTKMIKVVTDLRQEWLTNHSSSTTHLSLLSGGTASYGGVNSNNSNNNNDTITNLNNNTSLKHKFLNYFSRKN